MYKDNIFTYTPNIVQWPSKGMNYKMKNNKFI